MKYYVVKTKMDHTATYIVAVEDGKKITDEYELISGQDWVSNGFGQESVVSVTQASNSDLKKAVQYTELDGSSIDEIKANTAVADSGIE